MSHMSRTMTSITRWNVSHCFVFVTRCNRRLSWTMDHEPNTVCAIANAPLQDSTPAGAPASSTGSQTDPSTARLTTASFPTPSPAPSTSRLLLRLQHISGLWATIKCFRAENKANNGQRGGETPVKRREDERQWRAVS